LYAGARLLEIVSRLPDMTATLNGLPQSSSTPELQLKLEEGENFRIIAEMQKQADFPGSDEIITIDGLRVEYPDGFGLARSSNTTPVIVMRFEAETPEALARIQSALKAAILRVKPDAVLPF
jgi:phosphomannomutase/phosphoglucomutase